MNLTIVHRRVKFLCMAFVLSAFLAGCEVGINPLIFDGTPAEASFEVTSVGTVFPPITYVVNLQDVLSDIDDYVDSIKVYNITFRIEDLGGTNPTVTGDITVNGNEMAGMSGTPVSAFASERSIFDPGLQPVGFTYSPTIVPIINGYLAQDPKPTVAIVASGNSTAGHFRLHVKVYTQVFTTP